MGMLRAIRREFEEVWTVYGGVFPTYHWSEVMAQERCVDFVVRGEGEETVVRLMAALEQGQRLERVPGIVFGRDGPSRRPRPWSFDPNGRVVANPTAAVIRDLDACRVGWELIDFRRYACCGKRRAVVVQFSRGCPHRCHYCGQHAFWRTWRHRDPVRFAKELARLHREHGVELINFADETPPRRGRRGRRSWKP